MLMREHIKLAMNESLLTAFWITFPKDTNFPIGLGVTAHGIDDAYCLLEERGYEFHKTAKDVVIKENVKVGDLDYSHIVQNMGPIVVRGVWYPCQNVGWF